MSKVPAEIWEHQTKGMIDVTDMVGPRSVNFRLWKLVEHAGFGRVQRGSTVAEAGNVMTKYFDSSDSVVGHNEMSESFFLYKHNLVFKITNLLNRMEV